MARLRPPSRQSRLTSHRSKCSRMPTPRILCALALLGAPWIAHGAQPPATGLADSAALRATVFGPAPQDIAPLPKTVPLKEINIALPWARPLPDVLWFDRRLRVWLSLQDKPAALVIVIAGTGSDGNSASQSRLRAILYGAGYHVLTMPSPTSPRFIAAASSTGVSGDLQQDGRDLYAAAQASTRAPAGEGAGHRRAHHRLLAGGCECGGGEVARCHRAPPEHPSRGDDQPAGEPVLLHGPARPAVRPDHRARARRASSNCTGACTHAWRTSTAPASRCTSRPPTCSPPSARCCAPMRTSRPPSRSLSAWTS